MADLLHSAAGSSLAAQAQAASASPVAGDRFVQQPYGASDPQSSWRVGMLGERSVARELIRLRQLDRRWGFLHSIPVGAKGADIDHLLIGPGGVFTLNTKHHARARLWVAGSTFMVSGHRQPYVRNSRHEAQRAARLLSTAVGRPVRVVGVIVPVAAQSLVVREQPGDVWVIPSHQLAGVFSSCIPALPAEMVLELFAHARRPETWRAH
ncbi:hypothetical protein GCM10025789_01610 [Tessaracoccus lubricantis]|uniref:NERD domain-containing protein n=1 Tax=Tessaracoccus lubricantis TaxID=545543 RepID=A0ABP9EYL9_9ACTN